MGCILTGVTRSFTSLARGLNSLQNQIKGVQELTLDAILLGARHNQCENSWLLEFYIHATSKVISGQILTWDSAPS